MQDGSTLHKVLSVAGLLLAGLLLNSVSGAFFSPTVEGAAQKDSVPSFPEMTKALLERGETLYQKQCSACHGEKGSGDGKAAYLLYPKPRDFSGVRFKLISTDNAVPSNEDLFRTITRGMPGSAMPPWGHLTEDDRWGLVYYVKKLARDGKVDRLVREDGIDLERAERVAENWLTAGSPVEIT